MIPKRLILPFAAVGLLAFYIYLGTTADTVTWGNYGKITLPGVLGINHWIVIVIFIALVIVLFKWFENKKI